MSDQPSYEIKDRRNAPNPCNRLNVLVDVAQAAVDDARAVGMNDMVGEIDDLRQRAATIGIRLWKREEVER